MITIGSEARIPAGMGDIASPVPIEPMTIDDMFGAIIANVVVAADAETAGDAAAPAAGEEPAATAEASAASAVVQLLTLTVKQQAKALKGAEEDEPLPEADAGGEAPVGVAAEAAPNPAAPAPPAIPIVAEAQVKPQVDVSSKEEPKPLKAPVIIEGEVLPQPKTKSPVALAVAELMQTTRQIGLPQARRAVADPIAPKGEAKPFGQEVKQVVQQAISPMQAQPSPFALDMTQPLETVLEPAIAEPQLDPSEFAIEQQLDMSAEGEWLDSLAKDIARTAGEGGTLRFKLNPENLGSLRVEITPHANGSAVRLIADSDAARAIIADAQPRLVAEARANGVRIAETHVDLGGQNPSGDPRRQNEQFEEAPIRTARFLRDQEESDGKPTRNQSERYA